MRRGNRHAQRHCKEVFREFVRIHARPLIEPGPAAEAAEVAEAIA
ncbi:hypothetical protein [Methanosarcina sp. KYL-1]|nr:hypothetical protein [Methanosarcina sp. KYL-1]